MAAVAEASCADVGSNIESYDSLLSLMNTMKQTQCENKRLELLRTASKTIRNIDRKLLCSSMEMTILSPLFKDIVQLAVPLPAQFEEREHFYFERDDFVDQIERIEVVLGFLHSVLDLCNQSSVSDPKSMYECLPSLLLVLSSNIRKSLWSKDSLHKLTLLVLNQLRILYKVDSLSELLLLDPKSNDRETATPSSCLVGQYLNVVRVRLTRQAWQANPMFVESFVWMLTQMMKFPYLGEQLDTVLPPSLLFVDSHVTEHRVMGIQCLQHIAANVTSEQLRWYGRADVMFAALKQQMFSKEPEIILVLLPALLTILPVIDRNPANPVSPTSPLEVDSILSTIILNAITENKLLLRRFYTQWIPEFVEYLGVCAVRHLDGLVALVSNYLEIFDGPDEHARFNVLKILRYLLQITWPRIPSYADEILKSLLKLIQDLTDEPSATPVSVKEKLKAEAVACLGLLKEICPDLESCLQAVSSSEELDDVSDSFQGLFISSSVELADDDDSCVFDSVQDVLVSSS